MSIYWREYTQSREALTKKLLTCADFVVAEAWKVRNIPEGGGGAYLRGGNNYCLILWPKGEQLFKGKGAYLGHLFEKIQNIKNFHLSYDLCLRIPTYMQHNR